MLSNTHKKLNWMKLNLPNAMSHFYNNVFRSSATGHGNAELHLCRNAVCGPQSGAFNSVTILHWNHIKNSTAHSLLYIIISDVVIKKKGKKTVIVCMCNYMRAYMWLWVDLFEGVCMCVLEPKQLCLCMTVLQTWFKNHWLEELQRSTHKIACLCPGVVHSLSFEALARLQAS